ncbi:trypsin-like peptidase domain-containing protein [Nostoc sp. DedSLP04]|uniref:trypsin-like peptidase domain-containing protein n=1 Tax=Nostoc sp. DedSLP04 TaxID=3075401 RepID=UPI002AD2E52A|nr:trypsin-like peptidase domain-containing protein [Nostoc sp. DedSLP04]MDZ8035995.1 trypsin-like peptidase domain-containing protein [Nostoc sp. DedSLP04]
MMELPRQVQQEITQRLTASEKEREKTRQYLQQGELLKADSPERIEKRKMRLLANQSLTMILSKENREALATSPVGEAPESAQRALERQIGGNDTQPCWFLTRGTELRRTVGRIHIRDASRRVGWGTGFLVAPNLMVTNQHVLDSLETARFSRVEFDYEETFEGEVLLSAIFDLAPEIFFVSHPARGGMDYALVAVTDRARADSRRPDANLAEFGYNVLVREEGKLAKGEMIHSIHHPEGQPRQVSLRENRLTALQDMWLHYETDTQQGSSGAPLYNNQWEIVGIHHGGVEKRDSEGNILAIGGSHWTPQMGERQKWWYANEGLRISRFVADVEAQVKAALDSNAPPVADRVVTQAGHALFEAILKPSQNRAVPTPSPTVEGDGSFVPQSSHGGFNPE